MLPNLSGLSRLLVENVKLIQNCYRYEIVQFYRKKPTGEFGHVRKPMWLGTAKSRLTRFPNRKPYRPGELDELCKLYNDYRCVKKSLLQYFKQEYDKTSDQSEYYAQKQREEEEEHDRLMLMNQQENDRLAKLREVRLAKEKQAVKDEILQRMLEQEEKTRLETEKADQLVRIEIEKSKHFITPENLDEAIDRALAVEVDYNFAIDLEGNVYKGRTTTPDTQDKSKIIKIKSVSSAQQS